MEMDLTLLSKHTDITLDQKARFNNLLSTRNISHKQRHKYSWKKIYQANRNQKHAGVAILISDKVFLMQKSVMR
jgi:hypothetical protein